MLGDHEIPANSPNANGSPALQRRAQTQIVDTSGRYEFNDMWLDEEQSSDKGLDLVQYWRVLVKHRWVVIGVFVVSVALGIAATLMMTPIYQSATTLQIDRESARIVKADSVEPAERMIAGEEFFQTQYGLLKSRSLATRVVDNLGLANDDKFLKKMGVDVELKGPDGAPLGPREKTAERRRIAIDLFQANMGVAPVRGSRLVKLTFESPDAELAAQIANATAENFIASNLDRRFLASTYAVDFLKERLAQAKTKLEESERLLVQYAEREQIINIPVGNGGPPGSSSANQSLVTASLTQLNTALATARSDRIRAEERWRQAQSNTNGTGLQDVLQSPTIQQLSQTRAKVSAEYQEKSRIYKPDFPDMIQLRAQLDEIERQINSEVLNIKNSLRTQYDIARAQEKAFESQVTGLKASALDLRSRSVQYDILQREVDTNRQFYDGLLQRYGEVGVVGSIGANNISIVDRAEKARAPSKPRPFLNVGLAGIVGLGLGVLLAFLIELLDESVGTPEDVETKVGVTLLGSVPKLGKDEIPVVVLDDLRSAFSEAYYSIRTALQFSTAEGAPSTLLITSARPSEGKSTTALAIAKNFARLGQSVLLVDGDLRNPSMHRTLAIDNSSGLSNLLTGGAKIAEIARETDLRTLNFIPCGPLPPNPAELLAGRGFHTFLEEARQIYDIVVVDGPPVMGLADAPLLAAALGGTVFVIESGGTRRSLAKTALRRLRVGNARVLGAVLTKFNAKKASYGGAYAYAYDYNYGATERVTDKR